MRQRRFHIILFAILCTCLSLLGHTAPKAIPSIVPALVVFPDDSRQSLIDLIEHAQSTIGIASHRLSDTDLLQALSHAANRGVRVRVLLERYPGPVAGEQIAPALDATGLEALLRGAHIFVAWSQRSSDRMRANTMIIDSAIASISSCDFTTERMTSSRCLNVITQDSIVCAEIRDVFEADWANTTPSFHAPQLLWAPEHARTQLVSLISKARRSISVETADLEEPSLIHALSLTARKGIVVKVLTQDNQERLQRGHLTELRASGVIVRTVPWSINANMMLFDAGLASPAASISTFAFNTADVDESRGLGIVVRDAARMDKLQKVFDADWKSTTPTN